MHRKITTFRSLANTRTSKLALLGSDVASVAVYLWTVACVASTHCLLRRRKGYRNLPNWLA